jgi:hypothetical protein
MKCCAQSVKAAVRHSAGRRRGRFVGVSSARPAYFPGVPLPGCESGVWFRDYGPPSGAAYHDIGHRLRVKIKLIMPRRAAAEVASEARRGSSHHGCVHTAASKVIFRVAQCNTRTHFAALLATEQGEVARAACNAGAGTGTGAGTGASRGRNHIDCGAAAAGDSSNCGPQSEAASCGHAEAHDWGEI